MIFKINTGIKDKGSPDSSRSVSYPEVKPIGYNEKIRKEKEAVS